VFEQNNRYGHIKIQQIQHEMKKKIISTGSQLNQLELELESIEVYLPMFCR